MSISREAVENIMQALLDANLQAGEFQARDADGNLLCAIVAATGDQAQNLIGYCDEFFGKNNQEIETEEVTDEEFYEGIDNYYSSLSPLSEDDD